MGNYTGNNLTVDVVGGQQAGGSDFIQLAALAVSAMSAYQANRSARKEAAAMRSFQADMSSTSHQREVRDLRLAGLNPILSATGGSGASTPGGAMAPVKDIGNSALDAAMAYKANKASVNLMDQQAYTQRAQEQVAYAQRDLTNQQERESSARTAATIYDAIGRGYKSEQEKLDLELRAAQQKGYLDQAEVDSSDDKRKARWVDMYSSSAGGVARTAANAASAVRGGVQALGRGVKKFGKNLWGGHGAASAYGAFGRQPLIRPYRP